LLPGEIPETRYHDGIDHWIGVCTELLAALGRLQPATPGHDDLDRRVERVRVRLLFWLERLAALETEPDSVDRQSRLAYESRESARTIRVRAEASRVLADRTRTRAAQSVNSNQSLLIKLKEVVGRERGRDNL